ncbi:P-loop containing nucleoside triphosphate hydrolase protein, partial [Mycena leptocephala]
LPSEPKIFYEGESELSDIVTVIHFGTPRIAILGPGGMGKTSLARAALHDVQITARYGQHRFFVPCDSASSKLDLVALIGAHLGLKPGKDLTRPVIRHFSSDNSPCLLILDNLETIWEPLTIRGDVEEFLSLLTDIHHLALIITLRGAERPHKVQWTRPFLQPLKPLAQDAARKMFIDIADDRHNREEADKVLSLVDNLPLGISLLAHLVDSEGCLNVLSRWKQERTSIISEGDDKRSNLDLSISLSLSGPRMSAFPHSHTLLGVLSMLPDGFSDTELLQSSLPIDDILGCKATLIRVSLAYSDDRGRTKILAPIKQYMQNHYP